MIRMINGKTALDVLVQLMVLDYSDDVCASTDWERRTDHDAPSHRNIVRN